jgi:hypothetical protein
VSGLCLVSKENELLIQNPGKTILASRIIEECKRKRDFITSYFYCNESDPQRRDALSILKGLLVQLITQDRTLIPYVYMRAKSSGQGTLMAHQLTQSLVNVCCERVPRQFIVIDGLDECCRQERQVLLTFLAEVIDRAEDDEPGNLRVLIVSQDEPDITETLSKESRARPSFSVGRIVIQKKHNEDEIERFVSLWTDRIEQRFRLCIEETNCIKRLMSARTDGMGQGWYHCISTIINLHIYRDVSLREAGLGKLVQSSNQRRRGCRAGRAQFPCRTL